MSPARVVEAACAEGADLLLIADHDSFEGARAARREVMRIEAPLHIPVAAEILTEFGDVIVAFDDEVDCLEVSRLKEFAQLVFCARSAGGIVILPHPYRGHSAPDLIARDVDVIEVFNARCTAEENALAAMLAQTTRRAPAYAADAHFLMEVRAVSAEYDGPAAVATLRKTPRSLGHTQTSRSRIAFASLTKAVRERRVRGVVLHSFSFLRNLAYEALIGRSRLTK
ncbi:MAG: PHP domain-containing protein [Chloroflexota bacterium]|nr:PHP domain-containing protein [Chloroflexota bacterium]